MRRSQSGLGRLARNTGFLGLLGGACVAVAHAAAGPAPTLFRLTIVGKAHQEWSHTGAPTSIGACSRTQTTEGIRTTTFRTSRPIVVRLLAGRVFAADLRGITGTVVLGGANTTEEKCGDTGTAKIADCVQTRRSFAGARVRVSSPRIGVVALGPIRNLRLRQVDCPAEPVDLLRRPLGPVPGPLNLPRAALMERKIASITLSGTRSARRIYASPEAGRFDERAEWTLTFVRVKGSPR